MRLRLVAPIVVFVVSSATVGYGFVLPAAGHSIGDSIGLGFLATLIGAIATYSVGVRIARSKS
jgi:hypothetical protein